MVLMNIVTCFSSVN